ncbi:T9SS type A sorting domain-containing protein, partial [Bacteroidota bacterium]
LKPDSPEAVSGTWWSFNTTWAFANSPNTSHTSLDNQPFRFDLAGTGKSFKGGTSIISAIKQGPANIPTDILEHEAGTNFIRHSGIDTSQGIYSYPSEHGPSFIVQHLQALDKPGEWYFEHETKTVYLWPEDGTDPNGKSIRGKTQTFGLDLYACEYIEINGIGLFATTMKLDGEHISFVNGEISYPDMPKTLLNIYEETVPAIDARDCFYFTMRNCIVEYSQAHIIQVKNVGSVFENNYFHHLGMIGIGTTGCFMNINTFLNNTLETIGHRAAVKCNSSPESGRIQSWNILSGWGYLYANDGVGFQTSQGGSRNSVRAYNWFIRSDKPGHRYDGPDEGFPDQPTLGLSHHLVGLRTKSVSTNIKGDYNQVYNYLGIESSNEEGDIAIRWNVQTGEGNEHTIMRNCAADGVNLDKWDPLPCIHSNNWDASKKGGSMIEFHPDADLLDFRPKAGAPLLNAGYDVPGITDGYLGSSPDIGAYEWGDDIYWIPGYQKPTTSIPIPFNGAVDMKLDRDLIFLHGYESDQAIVYFSTNENAVINADPSLAKEPGTVDINSGEVIKVILEGGRNIVTSTMLKGNPNNYDPAPYLLVDDPTEVLKDEQSYYWRADAIEKNGEHNKGEVWSFTTGQHTYNVQFRIMLLKDGIVSPGHEASAKITNDVLLGDSAGCTYGVRYEPGMYSYAFSKKGYLSATDSIYISSDTLITDTIEYTSYELSVMVKDAETGEAIPGAKISFEGNEFLCGDDGIATIADVIYDLYNINASAFDYLVSEGGTIEVLSDTLMYFTLHRNYRKVEFSVYNIVTGTPIDRTQIVTDLEAIGTGSSGKAQLSKVTAGWWHFSLNHFDFFSYSDSVYISSDTSLTVYLTNKFAKVRFQVADSSGPLANANINFGPWSATSYHLGTSMFFNQPARQEYAYKVEMEGYTDVMDTMFLETDTTLAINLQLESSSGIASFEKHLLIYPNPVSEKLWLENTGTRSVLEIIHPDGTVLRKTQLSTGSTELDVSEMVPGIYFLRISNGDRVYSGKMVVE